MLLVTNCAVLDRHKANVLFVFVNANWSESYPLISLSNYYANRISTVSTVYRGLHCTIYMQLRTYNEHQIWRVEPWRTAMGFAVEHWPSEQLQFRVLSINDKSGNVPCFLGLHENGQLLNANFFHINPAFSWKFLFNYIVSGGGFGRNVDFLKEIGESGLHVGKICLLAERAKQFSAEKIPSTTRTSSNMV